MSKLLLGIDIETTGLDFEKDKILEVAFVLKAANDKRPWLMRSYYIYEDHYGNDFIDDECFNIHAISSDTVRRFGVSFLSIWKEISDIIQKYNVDYLVGHNSRQFDLPFLSKLAVHNNVDGGIFTQPNIDTMVDIEYAKAIKTRTLSHLAAEHGFINPFPHSALSDVLTTLKLLDFYDLNTIIERSASPTYDIQLVVPAPWDDGGAGKEFAKSKGFRWDAERKIWLKKVKDCDMKSVSTLPYPIKKVT